MSNEAADFLRHLRTHFANVQYAHPLQAINGLLNATHLQFIEEVYDYFAIDFEKQLTSVTDYVDFATSESYGGQRIHTLEIDADIYENAYLFRLIDKMRQHKFFKGNSPDC